MANFTNAPEVQAIGSGGYGGYGLGGGMGGFGTFGLFGLLGIDSLNGGRRNDAGFDTNVTLEQTIALNSTIAQAASGINAHIDSNFEVTNGRLDSIYSGINAGFAGVNQSLCQGFNSLNQSILESKYDNALQMCGQTNAIVSAIAASTQSIKDQQTCFEMNQLRGQIATSQHAEIISALGGPRVQAGAFIPVNPCQDNSRITNIENTVVQLANGFGNVQSALAAALAK